MNAKFFGQYLLEKGKITAQQLVDAVESQKSVHTPLGALAIEKEILAAGQVQKIHDEQRRTDRDRTARPRNSPHCDLSH